MKSITSKYLDTLQFSASQASSLKRLGEYKGRQDLFRRQTPEVLESLKAAAIIESSESSNRLEGITAPHERIEAIVDKKAPPQNRSEQEIAGYRDVLNLVHESGVHMPITTNVILQMHSILYRYLPNEGGRWKMTDNEIVERNPDGTTKRVRFKPTTAVETPHAMEGLIENYKQATSTDEREPILIIPLTILDFLCIHPFTDGNGRIARLITLLLLYHYDYEVGRYISLERIFEDSKESYYETLEASSKHWHEGKHNVFPWMTYFWGVLLRAYQEFEERVGTIQTSKGSKTEQIKNTIKRKLTPFSISDIEDDCPGISRDMIRIVLRQLRDEGEITPKGKGRGAKWIRN